VRAYNCLKRAGITQVGEIPERLRKGENEILAIRNFGQKSLDELLSKLEEKGFLAVLQGQKDQLAEIPEVSETVEESEPVELTAEEEPIS
jgi:DNA-directed RNA polymerase alpha subunit